MNIAQALDYWKALWFASCSRDERDWYIAGYWNGLAGHPRRNDQGEDWIQGYDDARGDWYDQR